MNTAVYTTVHVMKENSPIEWVSHELDGDWQFMGCEAIGDYTKIAMVVSLESIIKKDRSVLKVADLPMGYCATRKVRSDKWSIAKIDYSEQELKEFGFYCSKCGLHHKQIPLSFGTDSPNKYSLIPENEREIRCTLSQDQCIIDNKVYFIRGQIEIPVIDNSENFFWGVWIEVSEHDFIRIGDLSEDENRILEKPYFGRLDTPLDPYNGTIGLPVSLITQRVGYIPKVEIIESNHPLFLEQENGITWDRVIDFSKQILYRH